MLSPAATLSGTYFSRARQKWDTEKASASQDGPSGVKLLASPASTGAFRRDDCDLFLTETPCAVTKLPHGTSPVTLRRPIIGDLPTKDSMFEAFKEVDMLLYNRPRLPSFAAAEAAASSREQLEGSPSKTLSKSQSSPAFCLPSDPPNPLRARRDSERESQAKEGRRQLPHRSLALKLSAKRMLGAENFSSSCSPVPMAQHKVIGLHGAERHNLVDITALQNRCDMLGQSISVSQMLERRRQREQQDRLRRQSLQANSMRMGIDDAGSSFQDVPWEDRQEQVMSRRRQYRQEETYRRLLSTRQVRGLLRADREHPEMPGAGSAFIASSCASLARQLVDDEETIQTE